MEREPWSRLLAVIVLFLLLAVGGMAVLETVTSEGARQHQTHALRVIRQ